MEHRERKPLPVCFIGLVSNGNIACCLVHSEEFSFKTSNYTRPPVEMGGEGYDVTMCVESITFRKCYIVMVFTMPSFHEEIHLNLVIVIPSIRINVSKPCSKIVDTVY